MATFTCRVCGDQFNLPQATLDKYPGWSPKYCNAHSPNKKGRARRSGGRASVEENLTTAQVLAEYDAGPRDGIFTDGSCHPNPGPGGWGVAFFEQGAVRAQYHGRDAQTTNQRMELKGLIEALRHSSADATATVFTDSTYARKIATEWGPRWEANGWKKKGGEIQNLELVKELLALVKERPGISFEHVSAHAGILGNEYADALSTAWRRDEV